MLILGNSIIIKRVLKLEKSTVTILENKPLSIEGGYLPLASRRIICNVTNIKTSKILCYNITDYQ